MRRIILLFFAMIVPACAFGAPATPTTQQALRSKCDKLLETWQDKLSAEHFSSVVSPPFVIAGDGGMDRLVRYRDGTILPTVRALQRQFFNARPMEPILILLLESEAPYRRLAKQWCGDDNVAHFGYFRHDNIMLMNVATGTGTLVHELTHALIAPDLPDVPSWFNEGLASLYEQSHFKGEGIRGLKNWRLPALQRAIQENKLRPLHELLADDDFYNEERVGLNYAQARYLLMYLQENGTLERFYKSLHDQIGDDPTGERTLQSHIAPQTLKTFESDWRAWVLKL